METPKPKIIPIWATGMTEQLVIAIDPTIKVRERWGRSHGEAAVFGYGRYLVHYVSGRGNHSCKLIQHNPDGTETILKETKKVKYCELCEQYLKAY